MRAMINNYQSVLNVFIFNSKRLKSAAYGAKVLEVTGLSLSLIALSVSVVVFSYFRSVKGKAQSRLHDAFKQLQYTDPFA